MILHKDSVIGKVIITGELVLDEPLLIGDGGKSAEDELDIHVLRDKNDMPYIPGTALTGVLRSFLNKTNSRAVPLLFGTSVDDAKTAQSGELMEMQSTLAVSDVKLEKAKIILRDGVSIDPVTGTAIKHHKFDFEAVDSDASGNFRMEGTLRNVHADYDDVVDSGLELLREKLLSGLYIGSRTAKGFGRVHAKKIVVNKYDFREAGDVKAWLTSTDDELGHEPALQHKTYKGAGKSVQVPEDFVVDARFALRSSLIVRDYESDEDGAAAMKQDSRKRYIIPGSSLKGVMRHRAEYILRRLDKDVSLLEKLMGPSLAAMKNAPETNKWKSRFQIDEAVFKHDDVVMAKQSRNRIDRFTGGTVDTALFSTKPIWKQADESVTKLHFEISKAEPWEAGLALLLLKDLWNGRTAVGGEKGIGRGTLAGISANIFYQGKQWQLSNSEQADSETIAALQHFVDELIAKG